MGGALLLRPDGEVLCLPWGELEKLAPESDAGWRLTALVVGADKYPELRPLLPVRPSGTADCEACKRRRANPHRGLRQPSRTHLCTLLGPRVAERGELEGARVRTVARFQTMPVVGPFRPFDLKAPTRRHLLLISLIQSSNWFKLRWWALALNVMPTEACSDHVC